MCRYRWTQYAHGAEIGSFLENRLAGMTKKKHYLELTSCHFGCRLYPNG